MKIETLFIDDLHPIDKETDYLISKLSKKPQIVKNSNEVYEFINASSDPISTGKKTLYITRNKGAVIRACPGTSDYTCCDYTILHTGLFCNMDCSYCILQAYFHPPVLQYFSDFNKLKDELSLIFGENKIFRIGTGEYTDSLIWEKVSPLPQSLVEMFARQNNSILELKTKTVNIDSLLSLDHNGKTIIAWSLNTPEIISSEERGTASLSSRLEAAKKVAEKGYKLAFHFDPIVIYPGCEDHYKTVIQRLFNTVRPNSIVWISLGTFRFMPGLKQIIEKRFSHSTICYGEFIPGLDNKMRYFKPLRIRMYQQIVSCIRACSSEVLIYFCMEDEEIWEKCLGFFPGKKDELGHILDQAAATHCKLNKNYI